MVYEEVEGEISQTLNTKGIRLAELGGTEETQLGVTSTPSIYTYIKIYEAVYIETIMST